MVISFNNSQDNPTKVVNLSTIKLKSYGSHFKTTLQKL